MPEYQKRWFRLFDKLFDDADAFAAHRGLPLLSFDRISYIWSIEKFAVERPNKQDGRSWGELIDEAEISVTQTEIDAVEQAWKRYIDAEWAIRGTRGQRSAERMYDNAMASMGDIA